VNPTIGMDSSKLKKNVLPSQSNSRRIKNENLILALVILNEGKEPSLFLIPSEEWRNTSKLLVEHNYKNLKSKPEWGINLSLKNMPLLEKYRFDGVVEKLIS
jgi:hypothetical protein